ncbi:helix-turn-helix transcriptional regulator [Candidatus Sororendozoicomonas aggregata]|uniref:helix-turn-helix transcriptional regulator n=1 Tax=Candidatus Sororendozoicomonas aggregata TaxID=3073239 RepID=UPI003B75CE80
MSQYLKASEVINRYNTSKSAWYRWVSEGIAPKPVKIGPRCVRWKLTDLVKWEADREVAQ